MITILHLEHQDDDSEIAFEATLAYTEKRQRAAVEYLLAKNAYQVVAVVALLDMETAYSITQNGTYTNSWSMDRAAEIIAVAGDGYHISNGVQTGYRSTGIGDILIHNNTMYMVSGTGFTQL